VRQLGPPRLDGESLEVRAVAGAHASLREAATEQRARLGKSVLPSFDAQPSLVEATSGLEPADSQEASVARQARRRDSVGDVPAHRAPASRKTRTSPVARCAPFQHAHVFPVQPEGRGGASTTSTRAASATAAVSSSEWSSTTSTSSAGRVWARSPASRPGRRPASFRAGITTETRPRERSSRRPAAGAHARAAPTR
jgi:hypothetical protein